MKRRGWMGLVGGLACLAASGLAGPARAVDAPGKNPVDPALRLVKQAKSAYSRVSDYQCVMIKRETINGVLGPNQVVEVKVKASPFSVYMKWQSPSAMSGQEVCYVAGKNDGKMRCKPAGLLGAVGFVSLSPDDPRCKKTSNHPITRAGIGYLIEATLEGWSQERFLNATQVKVGTSTYARRRCTRVEMVHPSSAGGKLKHYKNVVYFDQETKLPIRVENYAWPKKQGEKAPLYEVFSYVNLRLNVGVPAKAFEK